MKKGLLMMFCLSLLAFAPACNRNEKRDKKPAMSKKTTKVKTKKTYKSGKPARGKKVVTTEESVK